MNNAQRAARQRGLLDRAMEENGRKPIKVSYTHYGWRKTGYIQEVTGTYVIISANEHPAREWDLMKKHPIDHRITIHSSSRDAVTKVVTACGSFSELASHGGTFGPDALEMMLANTVERHGSGEPHRLGHEGPDEYMVQEKSNHKRGRARWASVKRDPRYW